MIKWISALLEMSKRHRKTEGWIANEKARIFKEILGSSNHWGYCIKGFTWKKKFIDYFVFFLRIRELNGIYVHRDSFSSLSLSLFFVKSNFLRPMRSILLLVYGFCREEIYLMKKKRNKETRHWTEVFSFSHSVDCDF